MTLAWLLNQLVSTIPVKTYFVGPDMMQEVCRTVLSKSAKSPMHKMTEPSPGIRDRV
jgi:hypothetical protein